MVQFRLFILLLIGSFCLLFSLVAAHELDIPLNNEPPQLVKRKTSLEPKIRHGHWVTIWGATPELADDDHLPPDAFKGDNHVFFNTTIRQTLHLSLGAEQIRIRLSNALGGIDLPITAATVAIPHSNSYGGTGERRIKTETVQNLTFSGSQSYTIPNGALAVSDPINFKVEPESVITVSLYLEGGQQTNSITSHFGSRTTSWFSFGNHIGAEDLTDPSTASVDHWYFINGVEAWLHRSYSALVTFGDSITDGKGSGHNVNRRWPDRLLARMQEEDDFTARIAVVNQGASGNRVLRDKTGPNALRRLDRDVLALSGVKYAIIFEGINDIGHGETTEEAQKEIGDQLILAYDQIVQRLHAEEIPVFGSTIAPFMGDGQDYSHVVREQTRQRVNDWIRNSRVFDEVIDFDKVLANPLNTSKLYPEYDSGDYLHPSAAGYQAMANAFPLRIFSKYEFGISTFAKKKRDEPTLFS